VDATGGRIRGQLVDVTDASGDRILIALEQSGDVRDASLVI
jgi:hypothetical protein